MKLVTQGELQKLILVESLVLVIVLLLHDRLGFLKWNLLLGSFRRQQRLELSNIK